MSSDLSYRVRLHFDSSKPLSLVQTDVYLPGCSIALTCFRGSAFNVPNSYSGFRWSSAVQALSLLLLRYVSSQNEQQAFTLSGDVGSPAASLDYALSKQPAWLQDMFGLDEHGIPQLRSLLIRRNPERKRSGPVGISVQERKLPATAISVLLDGQVCNDPAELRRLAEVIEQQCFKPRPRRKHPIRKQPQPEYYRTLQNIFYEEVFHALRNSVVFDRRQLQSRIRRLRNNPVLLRRNPKGIQFEQLLDCTLSGLGGIGVASSDLDLRDYLPETRPFRIVLPQGEGSAAVLFSYLKHIRGFPIEIIDHYPHSLGISSAMRSEAFAEEYDAAVLSLAASATYGAHCGSARFLPTMLMPSISYSLLQPMQSSKRRIALRDMQLHCIAGAASHTSFLSEALKESCLGNSIQLYGKETVQDLRQVLQTGDENLRAMLWFPHNRLFQLQHCGALHATDTIVEQQFVEQRSELLLFGRKSQESESRLWPALAVALRGAWVHLLHDRSLLEGLIDQVLAREHYQTITREPLAAA